MSTQNDYLITGAGQAMPETRYTKEYLDKAVADARREVIRKLMEDVAFMREEDGDESYNRAIDDVLATLREEEGK